MCRMVLESLLLFGLSIDGFFCCVCVFLGDGSEL